MNKDKATIEKVGIYIRVSTEEQAKEGYSISAQKHKLKSFCIAQDWNVAGIYADEGISAKDMERPELKRMVKDIQSGIIDCVLVYRLDRLTRSVFDLYKLLEVFDAHDCKFKSATEVYDTTTAMGRMFITIVAALAQWERENMGERLSFGYAEKVRKGKYALNFRPFGYNLDLKTSKLNVKEDEAKTVKIMYQKYVDGFSSNKLCRYLNGKGITTRDGNTWNDKTVMDILKNPLYIGSIRWRDFVVEDTHEAIITKDQFKLVQHTIEERRGLEPQRVSSRYIFSGKIKCPSCGSPMTGCYTNPKMASGEKKKYLYYRCRKKSAGTCDGTRSISEFTLEDAFIKYIDKIEFEALTERVSASHELLQEDEPEKIDKEALEKELDKIVRRKKKWQYAWTDDVMTYEDFKKRTDEANKEESLIKEQLEVFEAVVEVEIFNKHEIEAMLKQVKENWYSLESEEKKNLVNTVIDQIYVAHDQDRVFVESIDFK
ncbi:recombinase family protein [Bacillus sp. FSL K6-3431]|uniref:recombinase family protein n=1 Tax=Bacillus sp. FSL K6-3431 TaxID=2921500 RepID=UPI0030F7D820